ncbi:SMP-30/gluconolactonase/LRE family protein [Psychrobacter pygoscelis]|uniref:SMP-30/gluconolactonase/LRE family protein n=1 Tax=Psychrobacter pygoscelis TaxID=2488563 RepID=UPI00103D9676|nr:SMP-30/gluconolactonase/LRE family protein [Psychrobacter pygoscelis]
MAMLKKKIVGVHFDQEVSKNLYEVSPLLHELGESPLWNNSLQTLFWVDILADRLYSKNSISNEISFWDMPHTVTAIATDKTFKNILWLISESALVRFNVLTGEYVTMLKFKLDKGYRTNDGHVGPDGKFWFGTMKRQPDLGRGQVYTIDKSGELNLIIDGISIPNTFCWLNNSKLVISDSLTQRSMIWEDFNKLNHRRDFINLSNTLGTPDGGAVDETGNIWIAFWGLGKIACVSPEGEQLQEIHLPVSQPSSCCFGGINNDVLFITTAREGLTSIEIEKYPHSGKVFYVKLSARGIPLKDFSLELVC